MPKKRIYESQDDVEKAFKKECKNLKGDDICLTPNQFAQDQIECKDGICKVDQKMLKEWIESKGEDADSCHT